jgi:hypothetical protein
MTAQLPNAYQEAIWWFHRMTQLDEVSPRNGATAYSAAHPEVRRNALEVVFTAFLEKRDTAAAYAAFMRDSTTEGKIELLAQLETEVLPCLTRAPELWQATRLARSDLRAELGGIYGLAL